jgi:ribosomal-protein-alanine N-acetyltransferase
VRAAAATSRPALRREAMTLADLPAVMAIEQIAYPFPWTQGNFVDSLAAGYGAQLLRAPDGTLRAYSVAMDGVDEVHLLNLTVAPPWQGQGLARRLLDTLVERARGLGQRSLWLEVRASNERARAVYARYGFLDVGMRRGYYPAGGGRREDARILKLEGPLQPGSGDAVD